MMKCNACIDAKTGIALEGEALEAALKDPNSPRCGCELKPDDVFCPSCGAKAATIQQQGTSVSPQKESCIKTRLRVCLAFLMLAGSGILRYISGLNAPVRMGLDDRSLRIKRGCLLIYGHCPNGFHYDSHGHCLHGKDYLFLITCLLCILAFAYFVKTSVRRLRDIGRSGWWIVPYVCLMIMASGAFFSAIKEYDSALLAGLEWFSAFPDLNWLTAIATVGMAAWLVFAKGDRRPDKCGLESKL